MHRSPLVTTLSRGPDGHYGVQTYFAVPTAQEAADMWAQGLGGATQKMQAGINRVQTSPGQLAAAQRQKWIAALQDPVTQDKWANKVGAVSLSAWKESMLNLGVSRAAAGAAAKKDKFVRAMAKLLPYVDQGKQQISTMPSTTYQDRENRMLAWSRYMRDYRS